MFFTKTDSKTRQLIKGKKDNFLVRIPCPICGNERLRRISRKGQFGLPCFVSICPSDGLVFLSPRWTETRYNYFYTTEYDDYYRPTIFSEETDDSKYKRIKAISLRLKDLDLIHSKKSVLDVGAGMGWSLQWIGRNYPSFNKLCAIESSGHCIRNIEQVVGADVISRDIESDWTSKDFDLVIMRHVLEHLLYPIESLRKIGESLSHIGILYIAVPDMMNPRGSLKRYWFRVAHTFYFSEATLNRIASMANLVPIIIKREDSELWGVFRKATEMSTHQYPCDRKVYEEQLKIIKSYPKQYYWKKIRNSLRLR
jgi:2-polyprenyl-3-methyl-5-hydroxy-6-metoxy-1,4-benzoquinol methylase